MTDTIFAVASGGGRAAVTVLRISGSQAGAMLDALCRRPAARFAALRSLRDAEGGLLDRALVLWFPGPGSYTGEDCVELHLHGGRAVLDGVSAALLRLGGRPAEAGEFTRRAFLNGRMDLLAAEAVGDLIEAETEGQARQALLQMDGALGALYRGWSTRLVRLLASMEALIDFPDEALPAEIALAGLAEIAGLAEEMAAHLDDGRRGELVREGLVCALVGPPNAGKSTLINALARREVAIVGVAPGTTRDVLEARMALAGVPVTLLDTAGLRESDDPVEMEGVRRARARAGAADIVVVMRPVGGAEAVSVAGAGRVLEVVSKVDLDPGVGVPDGAIGVSAVTGLGMEALEAALGGIVRSLTEGSGGAPLTRVRHRAALEAGLRHLRAAGVAPMPELMAEDVRMCLRSLGRIVGMVGVEALLDSIFSQFCIGK